MALTRVATSSRTEKAAALLVVDGHTLELSQAQVTDKTEVQIETALESAAALSNVQLPRVYVHINDDGSIALATGVEPATWPEDETIPKEIEG